jgi:hypothetical protein
MVGKRAIVGELLIAGALAFTPACHWPASSDPPAEASATPEYGAVVPAGTAIQVRLNSSLDTGRSRPGDGFTALLTAPIQINGRVVVPDGATIEGVVRSALPPGRRKGRAYLSIELELLDIDGSVVPLVTDAVSAQSARQKKSNRIRIPPGAAPTATASAGVIGKKQAHFASESPLTFHLKQPLQVTG